MLRSGLGCGVFTILCVVTLGCGDSGAGDAGKPAAGSGGRGGSKAPDAGRGGAGTGGSAAGSSGAAGGGSDESAELYDPDRLPRFDLTLSEESLAALAADPVTYVRGSLAYEGTTLTEIGVRIKGEGSRRTFMQKPALKLKFDAFVEDQTFRGLRRMTLNNMVEDPSFLAERLAYHMYRSEDLPAPRCNSALLYVNGDYYGVYANVETEDKTFLRRWFQSDEGNLYEEGQSDFEIGHEEYFDLETNETENDRSDLTRFFAAVAEAEPESYLDDLGSALDTDHFLRFTAMEATVNQWDMYSYTYFYPNNFRIYSDPTSGKFVFLPWGMDLSLKPFIYTGRPHVPVFGPVHYEDNAEKRISNGLLFRRCIDSASCKARYVEVLRETAEAFDAARLDELAARYYDQLKEHVYADWRKEVSNEKFEEAYQSLLQTIRTRTAAIEAELP